MSINIIIRLIIERRKTMKLNEYELIIILGSIALVAVCGYELTNILWN